MKHDEAVTLICKCANKVLGVALVDDELRITISNYEMPDKEVINQFNQDEINKAAQWLRDKIGPLYDEYMKIRELLPDRTWNRYRAWGGFEDHREVRLLTAARRKLGSNLSTMKRPKLFKTRTRNAWIKKLQESSETGSQ